MQNIGYLERIKTSRVYHTKKGSYYYEYFLGLNIYIKVKVEMKYYSFDYGATRTDVWEEYQGKFEKVVHNFDDFLTWYKKCRGFDDVVLRLV